MRTNGLTVSVQIETNRPLGEGIQAVISQWSPLESAEGFGAFDAFDASVTDGLDSSGYFGSVFDGRYVYFVPEMHADLTTHAVVLRYDTHAPFDDRSSYAAYDASTTADLRTEGFYGAAYDGRYVWFVPRQVNCEHYHSRALRLDTYGEFLDPSSWGAHDIGHANSQQGCASDGRFLYFCPGFSGDPRKEDQRCGRVIRCDTAGGFKDESSYEDINLTAWFGPRAAGFDGGSFDGRYIYMVPLDATLVVRYDTNQPFDQESSWQAYDARSHGLGGGVGAVFDGRFIYYVPYAHGTVVRFDTTGGFADPAAWGSAEISGMTGDGPVGYDGAFFDGRYVTFVPFVDSNAELGYTFHSRFVRYDTAAPFDAPRSWSAQDAFNVSGLDTVGYNAGAFDGRFFYCAPWQQGPADTPGHSLVHGNILRYDTLGNAETKDGGGMFSLRAADLGHNGGLCAAVPGPTFLINTDRGVRSVSAHLTLPPGCYQLTGIYDGQRLALLIDGQIVAERAATGQLVSADVPVTLGHLPGGGARFDGQITDVTINALAR